MDAATRRTLRVLARTRTPAEMKALFATIRSHRDVDLLSAAPTPARRKRKADFANAVADRLAPIVAPAAEKAEMLIEALAQREGGVAVRADGLVPTIRKLVACFGEPAVNAATDALLVRLAEWGSTRERVK